MFPAIVSLMSLTVRKLRVACFARPLSLVNQFVSSQHTFLRIKPVCTTSVIILINRQLANNKNTKLYTHFIQISHWCVLKPVCTTVWSFKWHFRLNIAGHKLHWKYFSSDGDAWSAKCSGTSGIISLQISFNVIISRPFSSISSQNVAKSSVGTLPSMKFFSSSVIRGCSLLLLFGQSCSSSDKSFLNTCKQSGHRWNFLRGRCAVALVCVRMCTVSVVRTENERGHSGQANGRSLVCTRKCRIKSDGRRNSFGQYLHTSQRTSSRNTWRTRRCTSLPFCLWSSSTSVTYSAERSKNGLRFNELFTDDSKVDLLLKPVRSMYWWSSSTSVGCESMAGSTASWISAKWRITSLISFWIS